MGKLAIDAALLGRIANLFHRQHQLDLNAQWGQLAQYAFEQGRFTATIGANHCQQAASGPALAMQVVDHRMAIVTQGQVMEVDHAVTSWPRRAVPRPVH